MKRGSFQSGDGQLSQSEGGFSGHLCLSLNLPARTFVLSSWFLHDGSSNEHGFGYFYAQTGSLEQIRPASVLLFCSPPSPLKSTHGCCWLAVTPLSGTRDLPLTSKWGKDTLQSPSPWSWAIKCFQTCNSSFKRECDTNPIGSEAYMWLRWWRKKASGDK